MNTRISRAAFIGALVVGLGLAAGASLLSRGSEEEPGDLRERVLSTSLAASAQLQSYLVEVSGEVKQGDKSAKFELTYEYVAPDKLRWLSESTSSSGSANIGLLVIGSQWWGLEGDTWQEELALTTDLRSFSAERIWSIVPFDSARARRRVEKVGDFQAWHHEVDQQGTLALDILAGSLLAAEEPAFEGELNEFKIDYWTEEFAGFPVQLKLDAGGAEGRLTLTARLVRVNDSSIDIQPPAVARPLEVAPGAAAAVTAVAQRQATTAAASHAASSTPQALAAAATSAPTSPPPTAAPPTSAPRTTAPATSAPATAPPPTPAPPTAAPQPTTAPAVAAAPVQASPSPVAPLSQTGTRPETSSASGTSMPTAGSGGLVHRSPRLDLVAVGLGLCGVAWLMLVGQRPAVPTVVLAAPRPRIFRVRPSHSLPLAIALMVTLAWLRRHRRAP